MSPCPWSGGETPALEALERYLKNKEMAADEPKLDADALMPKDSNLKPYIRFGCLSVRQVYHALGELYKKASERAK